MQLWIFDWSQHFWSVFLEACLCVHVNTSLIGKKTIGYGCVTSLSLILIGRWLWDAWEKSLYRSKIWRCVCVCMWIYLWLVKIDKLCQVVWHLSAAPDCSGMHEKRVFIFPSSGSLVSLSGSCLVPTGPMLFSQYPLVVCLWLPPVVAIDWIGLALLSVPSDMVLLKLFWSYFQSADMNFSGDQFSVLTIRCGPSK